MLKKFCVFLSLAAISIVIVGCAGPEEKLGRGFNNMAEFARGGEMRRSVEQSAIFGSPANGPTTGVIHGFNRSVARTFTGLYEVLTFPIPNRSPGDYGPIYYPADPVYPDSFKPNWLADTTLAPDTSLEFSGGDLAPFIPGSRFRIFDN
jgi:putative exosortase-associated protein (TIGR04073 family)